MSRWTDRFVADRMAVDRAFGDRVAGSEFSSQEWGTIMTAVEFEIEDAESPEEAELVADTSKVEQVMPALEEMRQNIGAAAGGPAGGPDRSGSGGDGLIAKIAGALGLGGSERAERAEAAAALAEEYARQFQDHLEREGKWEQACQVAARAKEGEAEDVEELADATGAPPEGDADGAPGRGDESDHERTVNGGANDDADGAGGPGETGEEE